jgi:polysaccharide biosynthesis protein VpsQ
LRRWLFAGAWIVFIAVIIWLADTNRARALFNFVERHPGADKVGHFFLIGGTGLFLNLALKLKRIGPLLLGSVIVAVVFTAEEFSQLHFSSRHFDLYDLAADFAGIVFFDLLVRFLKR